MGRILLNFAFALLSLVSVSNGLSFPANDVVQELQNDDAANTAEETLIKRFDKLENQVGDLKIQIDELKEEKMSLQLRLESEAAEQAQLRTIVNDLQNEVAGLEIKNSNMQTRIQQLEETVFVAQQTWMKEKLSYETQPLEVVEKDGKGNYVPRSCNDLKSADPFVLSGNYVIDPDGTGVGDPAFLVYCDMSGAGTSFVGHDSESQITVSSCSAPGCYSRTVKYNATSKQIAALIDISTSCRQYISYNCLAAPFEENGVQYSWWNDRNGAAQYFWTGNQPIPANTHTCQCAIDGSCIDTRYKCNCDSKAPVQLNDNGYISAMNLLPVTKLNFGSTALIGASGRHTLGRLECSGRVAVVGKPSGCQDLFRIGHTLSGFYKVKGTGTNVKKMETVYCDFGQGSQSSSFESRLGYLDVKTSPIHFYVQRNSDYSTTQTVIKWELDKLNLGNAMNLSTGVFTAPKDGVYHFLFSGVKPYYSEISMEIDLRRNGARIGSAHGCTSQYHLTASLHSTLQLKKSDSVDLYLRDGVLYDDGNTSHFTGWLDEEDLEI